MAEDMLDLIRKNSRLMIENDYLRNEIMKLTTRLNMPVYVVSLEDGTNFVLSDLL